MRADRDGHYLAPILMNPIQPPLIDFCSAENPVLQTVTGLKFTLSVNATSSGTWTDGLGAVTSWAFSCVVSELIYTVTTRNFKQSEFWESNALEDGKFSLMGKCGLYRVIAFARRDLTLSGDMTLTPGGTSTVTQGFSLETRGNSNPATADILTVGLEGGFNLGALSYAGTLVMPQMTVISGTGLEDGPLTLGGYRSFSYGPDPGGGRLNEKQEIVTLGLTIEPI